MLRKIIITISLGAFVIIGGIGGCNDGGGDAGSCPRSLNVSFEGRTYSNDNFTAVISSDGVVDGDGVRIVLSGLPPPLPGTVTLLANPEAGGDTCEIWAVESGDQDALASGTCSLRGNTLSFQNLTIDKEVEIGDVALECTP